MRGMILGWVFHFFGIHYFFFFSPSPNSCVFCGENQQITGLWFLYKGKWCWQGLVLQIFRQLDDISYLNLSLEGGVFPVNLCGKMKGTVLNQALVVVVVFVLCGCGLGKKCTNSGSPLSSHTLRYELLFSKNESRKAEALAHYSNLIRTDGSGWLTSLPRKALREEDEFSRAMKYQTMKSYDGSNSNFLKEFSLHDVRLGSDSLHWRAQQTNLEYLLMLDADRLVWSFRRTAGLPTPCSPYGGWESPDGELRGHFVGNFCLSSHPFHFMTVLM